MDCVERGFAVVVPDGTGGAGYLIDLGLGVSGLGWDGPAGVWTLEEVEEGCGWAGGSAGRSMEPGSFPGPSVWSTEHLLSATMVNS